MLLISHVFSLNAAVYIDYDLNAFLQSKNVEDFFIFELEIDALIVYLLLGNFRDHIVIIINAKVSGL